MKKTIQKSFSITEYPETWYFKVFPEAKEEDYERFLGLDLLETVRMIEKQNHCLMQTIRKVVVDDEYFEWLNKLKKENTSQNRTQYITQLEDEDVIRLWKKHYLTDFTVLNFVIPFVFFHEEVLPAQNIPIHEKVVEKVKNMIVNSRLMDRKDIVVWNELLRADYYEKEFMEGFYEASHNYFITEEFEINPLIPMITKQEKANLGIRFLPVTIREDDKPIMTRKEVKEEEKRTTFTLPSKSLEEIAKEIQHHIPNCKIMAIPEFVIGEMVEDYYEDMMMSLKQNIERMI